MMRRKENGKSPKACGGAAMNVVHVNAQLGRELAASPRSLIPPWPSLSDASLMMLRQLCLCRKMSRWLTPSGSPAHSSAIRVAESRCDASGGVDGCARAIWEASARQAV